MTLVLLAAIGAIAVFLLLVVLGSFTSIGPSEVGLVTKRIGKKLEGGQLVALNGEAGYQADLEDVVGLPMGDERFEARFEAHLADSGRQAALEDLLSERVADDPGIREALAALIEDEAVFVACATLVTDVISSESFVSDTTDVFAGMIVGIDAEELERRVDRVLVTPATEQAVIAWLERLMEAPSFGRLADSLGALLDDPNVQAELYGVLLGTPKGSAA